MYARYGTRQILFKLEATEGTDPVPAGATDAFLTFEAQLELDVDTSKRMTDRPFFTAEDTIETGTRAKITFQADFLGAAVAGNSAPISPILQGAGMAETLSAGVSSTFNPITDSIPSGTFYFYQGGQIFKCTGARGDVGMERSASNFGKVTYTYQGIVDESNITSVAAIPAVDTTAFRSAPVVVPSNWSVTANGVAVECVKHVFNFGNQVNYIPTSENGRVLITDRKPNGVLSMLLPDIGTFDPWSLAQARTQIAIVDTLTAGATLNSAINLPQVQLLKPKRFQNLKGGIQVDVPYIPYPTDAGSDEFNFVFT